MDNSILARCLLRDAPLSPQKGRMMADVIRGLPVGAALERLNFSRNKSGGILAKVLNSAVANAENNAGVDIDTFGGYAGGSFGRPPLAADSFWRPRPSEPHYPSAQSYRHGAGASGKKEVIDGAKS